MKATYFIYYYSANIVSEPCTAFNGMDAFFFVCPSLDDPEKLDLLFSSTRAMQVQLFVRYYIVKKVRKWRIQYRKESGNYESS